jgi:hypothetical protein
MQKLMEALDKKDFSDVPPDKLLKLIFECGKRLTKLVPKYEFKDEPDILGLGSEQRSFTFNPED